MNGVHDLGGMHGFGPVQREENEPAFHAAWDFGANGRAITNPEATQMLYSMYPSAVRRWIAARGGLTPHMIFLRGKQLQALYKPCYLDAQASATKILVSH